MREKYLEYLLDSGEELKRCSTCKHSQMGIFIDKCKYLGFVPDQNYVCDKYQPSWKIIKYLIKNSIKKEKLLTEDEVCYRNVDD